MYRLAFFLATSGHSGIDRAMQLMLPELARRGHRVDLLHVRDHGPYLQDPPSGINIIDLKTRHTYSSLPHVVRYLRTFRPVAMLSDKDRVNRTALLANFLARTPTRLIVRSGTTISIDLQTRGPLERWIQRNSMGKLYPFADNVIVPSSGAADDMSQYTGLARDLIQVVPSPVIPNDLLNRKLEPPDHPWFKEQRAAPLIISAGELCGRKDFETLLRAFATVHKTRRCRLMILGRGKRRDKLLKLSNELGIANDVALPGFVASTYPYIAHADLFAFTSRWEGLGFVLIEALAVGTPVVSTNCPSGPSEILRNGLYGPLVPVGDVAALAAAMLQVLDSPLAAEQLRNGARPYTVSAASDAYLRAMGLAA